MVMTVAEYLKGAPQRDAEAEKERKAAEDTEDAYFDALGALIEEHPIGRPVIRGHAIHPEDLD